MQLGLVTVLYNSPEVLTGFFESLAKQQDIDYCLWVIDNSTTLEPLTIARAECQRLDLHRVVFVRNDRNVGVAAANNQGVIAALAQSAEYVLLLNNDIEFSDPLLLAGMLQAARTANEHVIIPKMLYFDSKRIWCAGGYFRRWAGTTRHIGEDSPDSAVFSQRAYSEYAPTCFMLISRKVFETVGMMDERYFVYYDDSDFVWRLNSAGYRIVYEPRFKIEHKVSSSTGGALSPFSVYYYTRNRFLFISKNFSFGWSMVALPVFAATLCVQYLRYESKLRTALLRGIVDGTAVMRQDRMVDR